MMPDKFEREIEEILAKLDDEPGKAGASGDRSPISLSQKRQQKAKARRVRTARPNPFAGVTPTALLFTGAGVMFGGLILSSFWDPAIWAAVAGIALFIGAFFWSFRKTRRSAPPVSYGRTQAGGTFWRDRYIDDRPQDGGIKGRFRRK
jgi:hypothetical protein